MSRPSSGNTVQDVVCMGRRFGMNLPCIPLQQSPQPWKLSPLSQLLWPLPLSHVWTIKAKRIFPSTPHPSDDQSSWASTERRSICWLKLRSFNRGKVHLLIRSSWASTEEELVPDWIHNLFFMLQDLMNWEKWNLPRNHGVDWSSPVIVDLMQVTVTNSTEEDLELHISWPACSASKQASKQSNPMGAPKREKETKKQSKIRTQNPSQSHSIFANKNWPVLKNMLLTYARMWRGISGLKCLLQPMRQLLLLLLLLQVP